MNNVYCTMYNFGWNSPSGVSANWVWDGGTSSFYIMFKGSINISEPKNYYFPLEILSFSEQITENNEQLRRKLLSRSFYKLMWWTSNVKSKFNVCDRWSILIKNEKASPIWEVQVRTSPSNYYLETPLGVSSLPVTYYLFCFLSFQFNVYYKVHIIMIIISYIVF